MSQVPTQRRATPNHPLALDPVARVCALAVLLVGLVVLAGWALKIDALKSVLPGLASMKPNTALGFVLAGIALALRRRRGLRLGCAAAIVVLGGLSLAQDLTGADFGIDHLLFREAPGAAQTVTPGRMSIITAVDFVLLGAALLLLGTRRPALRRTLEALALLALALALLALIGYVYRTEALYRLPGFGSMAVNTALAFVLFAIGVLCARADGLAGVVASPGLGGQVARRFLPLAIVAPVVLGWLVQIGEDAGLFNATQDTAVFAAAMVLVLVAFSWRNALLLETSDAERRHAEEAHARLAMIVETSDDAIISKSIDGAILTWNAGAERMFGYRAEEAVGQPVTLLIPPQRLHEEEQILQRLRRGEAIEPYETVRRAKDGRHLDVALTISPLKDAGGSVIGASKILRDITDRKQSEQRLREREALLGTLTDRARVGMVMVTAERRYVFANAAYAEVLGLSTADIVGQRVADVLAPVYESQIRPTLDRAFGGERVAYELTLPPREEGEGERFFAITCDPPVETVHGHCVIVLVVDITERRLAEAALRQSEERYRSLFDGSLDVIFSLGADGRFVTANPAALRLAGKTLAQAQALHFLELCAPDQRAAATEAFRAAFCRQCLTLETAVIVADGTRRELFISGAPAIVNGEVVGVSCICRDITERKRAEAALREREAGERERRTELETLMAAIPAAVFISRDAACAQIAGNPAAMELLRLPHGRNLSASAPEGERANYQTWSRGRRLAPHELPMQRAAATGQAVLGAELDIVFAGGETRHVLGSALPLFDDAGAVRGCVGSFMDISERQRRERNLVFLAEMQKVLGPLTAAADIMRIASEHIAEHLSLDRCLLVEIDEATEQATVLHDQHAADAPSMAAVYRLTDFRTEAERRQLAAGQTLVIDDVREDSRAAAALQRFEALKIRALVSAPYVADGRWKFVLSASRGEPHAWPSADVALLTELAARVGVRVERARAEQQLRESEARWRFALHVAELGAWELNLLDHSAWRSPRHDQIFGYDALLPQWTYEDFLRHVLDEDRAAVDRAFRRAVAQHRDWTFECRIRRADGAVRWIWGHGKSVSDAAVAPTRMFGLIEDITARKEAEALRLIRNEESRAAAEVALASKYKSEFLANMSHELRTPLNSLLILSRLLADNEDRNLTPKQVEFAETMHHAGSDLLRLINEILDLSRIEAGQVEVYVEAIALAKLREKIERDFRHVAQSKQLEFGVSLDSQLPALIRSDANRLEQVLKNLLANSFKFTERGSVTLAIGRAVDGWSRPHASLDRAKGVVAFAVTDSGIGIAPEKQQLIFEAFAQADGTTSRKYGGSGLGLSISRELAGLLGGTIALTSQAGAGSTFTLYLPFTYTAPSALPHPRAEPTGRQVMAQPPPIAVHSAVEDDREAIRPGDDVLLIVEYDPVFARLLLDIAHRHAFKGLVASTAATALQLARQHQPAAITLSVSLPDMDGWTLLQRVNDDLGLRHIPVHIVSGEDERPRGLRRGAASYLQKPASEAVLGALFERIRAAKAREHSRLLVVEDDPAMQRQIVQALGVGADVQTTLGASADVQTTLVASAEEGLTELKARRYDCVVLDLRLPGMSGYEFLEAVRDELRTDDLPIVVYTGTEISTQQQARLHQLAESVLVKDARSLGRLLDQTSLYLHRRVGAMPEAARATLERLHGGTDALAGTKVLVVDDDMRNVFAVIALLENAGIEARHAENGIQCLEILAATADFDAVLMDIMMPEMDGYETLRRIRGMKGLEALPVIALTAKAMKGDRERCLEAGATDYLTKPVDRERLLGLMRYWICP